MIVNSLDVQWYVVGEGLGVAFKKHFYCGDFFGGRGIVLQISMSSYIIIRKGIIIGIA